MRTGKTIDQVITELERQRSYEYDMIVPRKQIRFAEAGTEGFQVHLPDHDAFIANDVFVDQVREAAGIPSRYYEACRKSVPGLAGLNLNGWFSHSDEESLVRSFYRREPGEVGVARAFLSPSYDRSWGHMTMLQGLIDASGSLSQQPDFVSCDVTDKRLYIKAIIPGLEGTIEKSEARVRDVFRAGFELRNSETGFTRGSVLPFVEILSCTNGMSMVDYGAWSKIHRGKRETETGSLRVIFASDTVAKRREALASEIRDALIQICSMDTVRQIQDSINGVATVQVANPEQSIKLLAKSYDLTQDETKLIEARLTVSGDTTRWGLIQAVTATAANASSYDRASELESLGSKLLLPESWRSLEKAA